MEEWKEIPGTEGFYEASTEGRIRSVTGVYEFRDPNRIYQRRNHAGRILKPQRNVSGKYLGVRLFIDGKRVTKKIQVLVALAHIGPRPSGMEVCHNDGNPHNNRLSNLRYDTVTNNNRDKRQHGTDHNVNKSHCKRGHLLESPNLRDSPQKKGHRKCKACHQAGAVCRTSNAGEFKRVADMKYAQIMSGDNNPRAFTPEQVRFIRDAVASGVTQASLAKKLSVSPAQINHIVKRRTYKDVT